MIRNEVSIKVDTLHGEEFWSQPPHPIPLEDLSIQLGNHEELTCVEIMTEGSDYITTNAQTEWLSMMNGLGLQPDWASIVRSFAPKYQ